MICKYWFHHIMVNLMFWFKVHGSVTLLKYRRKSFCSVFKTFIFLFKKLTKTLRWDESSFFRRKISLALVRDLWIASQPLAIEEYVPNPQSSRMDLGLFTQTSAFKVNFRLCYFILVIQLYLSYFNYWHNYETWLTILMILILITKLTVWSKNFRRTFWTSL